MGRHTLKKISSVPNGQLRQVRNLPKNAKVKAGLTWIGPITIHDTKVGLSEPLDLIYGGE